MAASACARGRLACVAGGRTSDSSKISAVTEARAPADSLARTLIKEVGIGTIYAISAVAAFVTMIYLVALGA